MRDIMMKKLRVRRINMHCMNCGEEVKDETRFCPKCGSKPFENKLEVKTYTKNEDKKSMLKECRACGKIISKNAKSCPVCGEPYTSNSGIIILLFVHFVVMFVLLVYGIEENIDGFAFYTFFGVWISFGATIGIVKAVRGE